jgi:hypothetical protein
LGESVEVYFIPFREFFKRFFTPKNKSHVSRNWLTDDLESSELLLCDDKFGELKDNNT